MPRLQIVGLDNGAGQTREALLVAEILRPAGIRTAWTKEEIPSRPIRALGRLGLPRRFLRRFDINLFLERLHPTWFPLARWNLLLPNPEWLLNDQVQFLAGIDLVLCKSRNAEEIFRSHGKRTQWIGFTARDLGGVSLAASGPLRALHLAGQSEHKGTSRVLEVWRRHPDWPELTVVQRPLDGHSPLDTCPAPNIRFLTGRLTDEEVLALQRGHSLHLLPSEVEGYGQTLVEGLSVGAVVVTTAAPPMNEVVTAERGVLVAAGEGVPFRLGRRYLVDPQALERAVADVLSWSQDRRSAIGAAARAWFEANDRRFRQELPRVVRAIGAW